MCTEITEELLDFGFELGSACKSFSLAQVLVTIIFKGMIVFNCTSVCSEGTRRRYEIGSNVVQR